MLIFAVSVVAAGAWSLQRPALDALLPRLVERDELTAAGALSTFQIDGRHAGGPRDRRPARGGHRACGDVRDRRRHVRRVARPAQRHAGGAAAGRCSAREPDGNRRRPALRAQPPRVARHLPRRHVGDVLRHAAGALPADRARASAAPACSACSTARRPPGALLASATSGWATHVSRHGRAVVLRGRRLGPRHDRLRARRRRSGSCCVFLAVAGGADAISGIFRRAMWNETIPDELRGRLASIEMISFSSGPLLGNVEAGGVASLAGVRFSIVSGGVLCVVGAAACALLLPAFWRYERRARPRAPRARRAACGRRRGARG